MRRARRVLLAALALALLAGAPAAVAGEPIGIAESFPTKCGVDAVTVAPAGGAWFACTEHFFGRHRNFQSRAKAGRITAAGQVTEFSGPAPSETEPGRAPGVVAADGSFWFPVEESFEALTHPQLKQVPPSLARVDLGGEIRLFPISGGTIDELVADPDGSLRFKTSEGFEHKNAAIWRISPGGSEIAKTAEDPAQSLGEAASFPRKPADPAGGIVAGSVIGADGNLWYSIQNGIQPAIGRLTPSGETTEFRRCLTYGQPYFGPETLARGAEGNIWFTSLAQRSLPNISDPPSIGMITAAGAITQIYAGVRVEPKTITADPEGGAWFAGGLEEIQRIKPPVGPVNTVHIGKLDEDRPGAGLLRVKVPSAGRLQAKAVAMITGKNAKTRKRTAIHAPAGTASASVCGTPQVRVKLAGKALRLLRLDAEVRVAVAVTFTPAGGTPYTEEKTYRFHLPPATSAAPRR
jgi:streptogramin lyase